MSRQVSFALLLIASALLSACASSGIERSKQEKAAETYVQLGVSYLREGQYSAALDRLKRALEIRPELATAHDAIATLYEKLGKMELANEHYQKSVELAPDSARAHNNYGRFLCSNDQYDPAQREFALAYKDRLYQNPWIALTNAGVCELKQGDEIQAETYFRKALQMNPKFPAALAQMVSLTHKQKTWLSTRAYLQRYWEVSARSAQSLLIGIEAEKALGNRDAVASYELSLKARFPDSKQVMQLNNMQQGWSQ